jgi:hypothetical protein
MLQFEKRVFSQNGEDGIIEHIFDVIGTTSCYYLEIGAGNGLENNTRHLQQMKGFKGIQIDANNEDKTHNLYKYFITVENLEMILENHKIPKTFDLFSLDIDFNDWHVLREFLRLGYKPNVIVVEQNAKWGPTEDKVSIYDPLYVWDITDYFGGSIFAFCNLCNLNGYSLVYSESCGANLFFVLDKYHSLFENVNNIEKLYVKAWGGGHPDDPKKRPFERSSNLLYGKEDDK